MRNLLVWKKGTIGRVSKCYGYTHELIIFCAKEQQSICKPSVFEIAGFSEGAKKTNGEKVHPTQKPVELFEKFILDATEECGVVLDCFMGSGTLAVAALRTKRHYIGFEIQDKYCKTAHERIEIEKGNIGVKIENKMQEINLFSETA